MMVNSGRVVRPVTARLYPAHDQARPNVAENPDLADIYALVEHLTGRPVTEAEKRACERIVAAKPGILDDPRSRPHPG